ncbi:MAG: hypothetical protein R3C09_11855 [Pirellulaceae bacterium]
MLQQLSTERMGLSTRIGLFCGLMLSCGLLRADDGVQQDRSAPELLPESVVAVAEIPKLGAIADTLWDHPLRQRLLELPVYKATLQSKDFKQFQQGVNAFESAMGEPWLPALTRLTDGGVTLALSVSQGPGITVLIRSSDQNALEKFRDFILAIRLLSGKGKLVQQAEYRGLTAHALNDDAKMVLLDHYLLLTNQSELGKAIVDRYLDPGQSTLQTNERYQQTLAMRNSTHPALAGEEAPRVATAFLDLQSLRQAGVAKEVYHERSGNYFGELLLGGLLTTVRHAPCADVQLQLSSSAVGLHLATEHQRGWEPPREYTFGAPELGVAPPLLTIPNRLFALSAHRDLSQMWLRAGELLTENAEEQLAQADTQLVTLLSGHDFGEDILGSFGSDVRIVAQVQDFADRLPRPAIQLPSFAFEFQMKDASESQTELRRIFQSFIGFINVTGATNGMPPFDLGMEAADGAQYYTATYVPNRDQQKNAAAPINFNFSPTIAFVNDRFIVSSTTALARELVQSPTKIESQPAGEETEPATHPVNTSAVLDAEPLRSILQLNKSHLIANNMLEQGHTQEEAAAEIGLLLELVEYLRQADLRLDFNDGRMEFDFELKLAK